MGNVKVASNLSPINFEKPRYWSRPMTKSWYLTPYNPLWAILAQDRIMLIKAIMPEGLIVDAEHVGSTAIVGIIARPCISINFCVTSVKRAKAGIQPLLDMGWEIFIDTIDVLSLIKREKSKDLEGFQIYFITKLQRQWHMKKAFRDYMIAHPEEAQEYEQLKIRNAELYQEDVGKYRMSKSEFILDILHKCGFKKLYLGDGSTDEGGIRVTISLNFLSFYGWKSN